MTAEWPHGASSHLVNTWPESVPHCYQVRLQPVDFRDNPWLTVIVMAHSIAEACANAERLHLGHIAEDVEDVS